MHTNIHEQIYAFLSEAQLVQFYDVMPLTYEKPSPITQRKLQAHIHTHAHKHTYWQFNY